VGATLKEARAAKSLSGSPTFMAPQPQGAQAQDLLSAFARQPDSPLTQWHAVQALGLLPWWPKLLVPHGGTTRAFLGGLKDG
jgi:hypothetical protein